MHTCHSINAWYVLVMLSFYDTCSRSTCYRSLIIRYCIVWGPSWGPSLWGPSVSVSINTLWQPKRLTWSVSHKVFVLRWYHTCYHVLPTVIWCYLSMIHALHVIDLCSLLRCDTVLYGDHRYGNRRYGDHHMGTIQIRRYQYNDIRRYIQLCVIACLGVGGVHMYHHSRQVGVGLRYCDTYQLRLCVRSVVAITLSCNCRTESW
jgi:hypothetical protein